METGIELIAKERERHKKKEGWTLECDRKHVNGELAIAAACYALPDKFREMKPKPDAFNIRGLTLIPRHWPWKHDSLSWKPSANDRIKELTKAGSLIAAEIDRLQKETEG